MLLLAAGRGERLGRGEPKALCEVGGQTLLRRAAGAAAAARLVDAIVAAVPAERVDDALRELRGLPKPVAVVAGAESRQASAAAALAACGPVPAVAVHDAARALCPPLLFDRCLQALDDAQGVVTGIPCVDTLKRVFVQEGARVVDHTPDRSALVAVQTPQAFRTDVYRRAHEAARRDGVECTDDGALLERLGVPVAVVDGDVSNIKITSAVDVLVAEALIGS